MRLNPVVWKKKTHLGSGRGCVAERAVRQLQPRQPSGEAQLELVRQLQRQPRRSVLPGLPITPLVLTAGGCLMKVILTIRQAFFLSLEAVIPFVSKRYWKRTYSFLIIELTVSVHQVLRLPVASSSSSLSLPLFGRLLIRTQVFLIDTLNIYFQADSVAFLGTYSRPRSKMHRLRK